MRVKTNKWIILLGIAILLGAVFLAWRYATQYETRLFALDIETGRVRWSRLVRTDWTFTPAAGNGQVLAYSLVPITAQERDAADTKRKNTIKLCAFEAATGRQLWEYVVDLKQFDFSDHSIIKTPPFIDENGIVASLNENTLALLDGDSGSLRWYSANAVSDSITRAFTFAGDRFIMVSYNGTDVDLSLQALDAQTGAQVWKTDSTGVRYFNVHLDQPAITTNDRMVFVSSEKTVNAFDLQSGAFQFSVAATSQQLQAQGDALFINTKTSVLVFDAATGAPRWTFLPSVSPEIEPYLFGLKTVGQVTYIISSSWGEDPKEGAWLFALDAIDGHEMWRRQLFHAATRSGVWEQLLDVLPAVNQDVFVTTTEDENGNVVTKALSTVDGTELWHFSLYRRGELDRLASPTIDGKLVFVTDYAPRWHNWLKAINLAGN